MKYLYVPVFRMAVNYIYGFGKRWSLIEQLLLIEISCEKQSVATLAKSSNLPYRLIIEALINLLRMNWVEVRSEQDQIYFVVTGVGRRHSQEKMLPVQIQKAVRWDAFCIDRLTGHWMRADELDLVFERDLPEEAAKIDPILYTFEPNDAGLRDLFRLKINESLEPTPPQFRPPSLAYARVGVAFDKIETGLPLNVPLALKQAIVRRSQDFSNVMIDKEFVPKQMVDSGARDDFTEDDIIVGGPEHIVLLKRILSTAKSTIIIHSCFLSPKTINSLISDFELATRRGVRIELLWGLNNDPEEMEVPQKVSDVREALELLPLVERKRINLAPQSSLSHAKVIIYDAGNEGIWTTVVGSCNYLSSDFDWMEVSVCSKSLLFTSQVLSRLLSCQIPAVGSWTGTAHRLNSVWSKIKQKENCTKESGLYSISLVDDHDHYSCVTLARDTAKEKIEIVSDLYGLAAETAVLVPMETAAKHGIKVSVGYTRASRLLLEEQKMPSPSELKKRGIVLEKMEKVHAKYLGWDNDNLVITSFNWMATALDGGRSRGAEIGAFIEGPNIHQMLIRKLSKRGS